MWIGWSQAPKHLTVHIPPDLRSGAVLKIDEVPPSNVYAFAFYIFQQLNRWPNDGTRDYGQAMEPGGGATGHAQCAEAATLGSSRRACGR